MTAVDLGILLAMPAILMFSAIVIWPAAARAKFVHEMSHLRDKIDDAVIDGRLPNDDVVRHQIQRADALASEPKGLSISFLLAMHTVFEEAGVSRLSKTPPSYAGLTPAQRKLMMKFDEEMVGVLATYIRMGSRFWLPLWCSTMIVRRNKRLRSASGTTPKPSVLAKEVLSAPDPVQFQVLRRANPTHLQHVG